MTSSQQAAEAPFADPRRILRDAIDHLLPPERVSLSEYSAEHRWLTNIGGGYTGRWKNDIVPYLVEPMDRSIERAVDHLVIVGPGQSGKTTVFENRFLYSVDRLPGKLLWYMPTDATVQAYVKDRIEPLIDGHDVMKRNLGLRAVDDSLSYKRFKRNTVEFLAANQRNMISKSAPTVLLDEIDAYPSSLGDPKQLADVRRQTFGSGSFLGIVSHPDLAEGLKEEEWNAGVMLVYRYSTQGRWYWPCPDCGGYSSPCPGAERFMRLDYPADAPLDEIADAARLICPCCGSADIEDSHRYDMNLAGKWVHRGETIEEDGAVSGVPANVEGYGYWIVGAMSPFVKGGIGGLAQQRVRAERTADRTGDYGGLKEVMCKSWGFPWASRKAASDPIDPAELAARAESSWRLGEVPDGVRAIFVAIDVQASRFVVQVEGFGLGGERWLVDRFDVVSPPAGAERLLDPARYAADWQALEKMVAGRVWPFASDPSRGLRPMLTVFDSQGRPGVTTKAYDFWRRQKRAGRGNEILPLRGDARYKIPRVAKIFPDSKRQDRNAGARGEVPVLNMAVNRLKDDVDAALRCDEIGPGYFHFPKGTPDGFFQEYAAEAKDGDVWVKKEQRNESFDLSGYVTGAFYIVGGERITDDRIPDWFEMGEVNRCLVDLTEETESPADRNTPTKATPAKPAAKKIIKTKLA